MLATMGDGLTVKDLTLELGYDDGGRAVRAALRKGFPDNLKKRSMGSALAGTGQLCSQER
jgi:hypothetical protein